MLILLTGVIMLAVAYAYLREGLLTAVALCCNVLLAGLVAFALWEPLAAEVESVLSDTFLQGYEDCFCLMALFCLPLIGLRWLANTLANTELDLPPLLQQGGTVVFALVAGYLLSGFLVCVCQTLPWQENFLGFDPKVENYASPRRYVPPDRAWLALMHWAGGHSLSSGGPTFDPEGSFTARYARLRRYKASEKGASEGER
jgi:hypothetical protein